MTNQDASPARDFHQATKLVYINLSNKPSLYKAYPQAEAVSLPEAFPTPQMPALEAIQGGAGVASGQLDLPAIAGLLYHSAGVIRKATHATAGEVHYRAAASAGALYPVETYLVCQDLPGLEAGIYHFAPAELKLHRLRSGDYRGLLAEACGGRSQVVDAPLILVYTTIFWRSAWKYRTRGYRYCYWDTGTVLANLLASAASSAGAMIVACAISAAGSTWR